MTPATTKAARPSNRRELILGAAADLFARHGFDGVAVSDIAEAVDVTPPALYRHFANKEAILVSIVLDTVGRLERVLSAFDADAGRLESGTLDLVTVVLDHPGPVLTYLRERHRLTGDDAALLVTRQLAYLERCAALVAVHRPQVPEHEIRVRVVAAIGVLRGLAERPPTMPRPDLDTFLTRSLLDLLTAPQGASGAGPVASRVEERGWSPLPSKRDRILAAALPLFRERGFAGVGIGEIGEAAGVGATNVHRSFSSKEEILVEIYDRVGARVEVAVDRAVDESTDAEDALARITRAYCEVAFDAVDLVVVVSQNRRALPAAERPRLRRRGDRFRDLLTAVVAELRPDLRAVEVATLAGAIFPLVNSFPQQPLVDLPSTSQVVHLVESLVLGRHGAPGTSRRES